jgi:hypothetical protein
MILATLLALLLAWPIAISVVLTVIVLLLLATEHEFYSSALVLMAVGIGLYAAGASGAAIQWGTIGLYILGYFVVGFVFTAPKWYLWAQKMGRKFGIQRAAHLVNESKQKEEYVKKAIAARLTFVEQGNLTSSTPNEATVAKAAGFRKIDEDHYENALGTSFETLWNDYFSKGVMKVKKLEDGSYDVFYIKANLVGYLTSWILNWPFYMLLLLIEDFLVEIVNWFADRIGQTFRNIARKAFNANITA